MRAALTLVFVLLIAVIIFVMVRKFIFENRSSKLSYPELAVNPEMKFRMRVSCIYIGTAVFDQSWSIPKNRKFWRKSKSMLFLNKKGIHIFRIAGSFTIPMKAIKKIYLSNTFYCKKTPPNKKVIIEWEINERLKATGIRFQNDKQLENFIKLYNKVSKVLFVGYA